MTFVFLDGWAVGTGRAPGLIARMEELGFVVIASRYRSLSEADAEEIYRTNHPIREDNSWHLARLVYPMGRSLGLLLSRTDGQCPSSVMRALKGKANPRLQRAGQLRFDFNAPNRILSLMHSSDDAEAAVREGRVFFKQDEIERAMRPGSQSQLDASRLRLSAQDHLGFGIERLDEPGLIRLMARVRLRLCDQVNDLAASEPLRSSCLRYRDYWLEVISRSPQPAQDHAIIQAAVYCKSVQEEQALVDAIRRAWDGESRDHCEARSEFYTPNNVDILRAIQCIVALAIPSNYATWDSEQQMPRDVLYDAWEKLLFQSYLFNFDDMLPEDHSA